MSTTYPAEIEQRLRASAQFTDGVWRWRMQRWGDLDVVILPRTVHMNAAMRLRQHRRTKVADSNTGIVVAAPKHAYLLGNVVVNDGARINCDPRALNYMVAGNTEAAWDSSGLHAYAVPSDAGCRAAADDFERACLRIGKEMPTLKRDQIRAQAEFMLGWGAYTIQCAGCRLVVPCESIERVTSEAQRYEWKIKLVPIIDKPDQLDRKPICRRCLADIPAGPLAYMLQCWPDSL